MTDVRKPSVAVTLAIVLIIGLALRLYHLDRTPRPLQTADEYAWTWAGMSLLRDGVPQSWSYLDAYPTSQDLRFHDQHFKLVKPWLDHPPVFAVLMGAWAHLTGHRDPVTLPLGTLRVVPVALWIISFVLLTFVLAPLFEPPGLVVAMVVFATSPPMVLQSKLVVAENLLVPILLVAYLCLLRYDARRSRAAAIGVGACALAILLIKIAALALSAFLLVVAVRRRQLTIAIVVATATVAGIGLFFAYGAHFGMAQFTDVQRAHTGRWVGFNSGLILLISTHIVNEGIIYPLFTVAALAMVLDAVDDGRASELYLLPLVYVVCMTFFADQRSVYGWYWLPLYPALAAGSAAFVLRLWRGERVLFHALWVIVMLPWPFNVLVELDFDRRQLARMLYLAVVIVVAALLLFARERRRVVLRVMTIAFVALQLATDVRFVLLR